MRTTSQSLQVSTAVCCAGFTAANALSIPVCVLNVRATMACLLSHHPTADRSALVPVPLAACTGTFSICSRSTASNVCGVNGGALGVGVTSLLGAAVGLATLADELVGALLLLPSLLVPVLGPHAASATVIGMATALATGIMIFISFLSPVGPQGRRHGCLPPSRDSSFPLGARQVTPPSQSTGCSPYCGRFTPRFTPRRSNSACASTLG